jgi:hypothetical protein
MMIEWVAEVFERMMMGITNVKNEGCIMAILPKVHFPRSAAATTTP